MTEITKPMTEDQQSLLEKAEKQLEKLATELDNKKYQVNISDDDMNTLKQFILKDAQWKFTEALGIVEIEKELKLSKSADGKYYLGAVATEAVYYYMSKVEGNGKKVKAASFNNIDTYLRILRSITTVIEAIKKDTEERNKLEFEVAARKEGIEPEKTS